jgi:hypothetical protein
MSSWAIGPKLHRLIMTVPLKTYSSLFMRSKRYCKNSQIHGIDLPTVQQVHHVWRRGGRMEDVIEEQAHDVEVRRRSPGSALSPLPLPRGS